MSYNKLLNKNENFQKELVALIELQKIEKSNLDSSSLDYSKQIENLEKAQEDFQTCINKLKKIDTLSQKFDALCSKVELAEKTDEQIQAMSREELLQVLERKQNFENKKV